MTSSIKVELERALAEESGDYYQVVFQTEDRDDAPYVLIQRQFEEPDGGVCYIETHDANYTGHYRVAHASLSRNRFRIQLRRQEVTQLEVSFESTHPNHGEVLRILKIMLPRLEVHDAGT